MFEKVKAIIVETLNCDEAQVTMDARLAEDLDADSLDAVRRPWAWPCPTRPWPRSRPWATSSAGWRSIRTKPWS